MIRTEEKKTIIAGRLKISISIAKAQKNSLRFYFYNELRNINPELKSFQRNNATSELKALPTKKCINYNLLG